MLKQLFPSLTEQINKKIKGTLSREGVMSLHELWREEETQMDRNQQIKQIVKIADMPLLVKCYDNKMVKSPG